MIAGIERLRQARETLDQPGQSASYVEALVQAAEECWSVSIDGSDWPVPLRVRIVTLQRMLFRYGGIRGTVEGMTDRERFRLRQELVGLIEAAEALDAHSAH
jgi:hypothetical protein